MGQQSSNSKAKSLLGNSQRDDGCIGNRKVRTILLSIILIAFAVMAQAYCFKYHNTFDDPNLLVSAACTTFADDDGCKGAKNAWLFVIIGGMVAAASAALAILLFFINAGDNIGRICGAGLITGGVLYIVGWFWWITIYKKYIQFDILPEDTQEEITFQLACWFGEALLPAGTAILLGFDVFMHLFDNESNRLASNLSLLFVVAGLCCTTYYRNSDLGSDNSEGLVRSDSYAWIATGYVILWWVSLMYIILYVCQCCTCNCKDTACSRLVHCVGLIIGGLLACVGYYYKAADVENSILYSTTGEGEYATYLIGYTVLLGGVCAAWSLDIGLDDLRSKK